MICGRAYRNDRIVDRSMTNLTEHRFWTANFYGNLGLKKEKGRGEKFVFHIKRYEYILDILFAHVMCILWIFISLNFLNGVQIQDLIPSSLLNERITLMKTNIQTGYL